MGCKARARVGQRDAGAAAAEVAQRDDAGRTAVRAPVCRAASAAAASEINSGATPSGSRPGFVRSAPRSAPSAAGPQCAGTAIVMRSEPAAFRRRRRGPCVEGVDESVRRRGATTRPARPAGPGRRPARRIRHITTPCSVRFGFSPGSADLGRRGRRTASGPTGASPARDRAAATRLVVPIDNPSVSLIARYPSRQSPDGKQAVLTIAAPTRAPGNRRAIPLMRRTP